MADKRWEAAETCYRRAISTDPSNEEARLKLVEALGKQGQFEEAARQAAEVILLAPDTAEAHYLLGAALLGQAQPQHAIPHLLKALSLEPKLEAAYRDLCLAHFRVGQLADAKLVVADGLAACPASADLHFYQGNLLNHEGDLDGAARCYVKALEIRPASPNVQWNLGHIYEKRGRLNEALACFLDATRSEPRSADGHVALAKTLGAIGRTDEAASQYRQAIALAPASIPAHLGLGSLLLQRGKIDDALAHYQSAIATIPDNAELRLALGAAEEKRGNLQEAILQYRHAAALRPDHIDGHHFLGNALLKSGAREEALACYCEMIRLQPEHGVGHLVAALSSRNTDRPSGKYVEKLFDDYAENFDSHLVHALQYGVPDQLADATRRLAGGRPEPWDILDLGCGTGLMGVSIAPHARSLVGVDLSANMLTKAKARGLYQRLEHADLLEFIGNEAPGSFDLILAADVLAYLGRLDELMDQAKRILRPGGVFGFSVEALDASAASPTVSGSTPDFQLRETGRYAHSRAYLERLALEHQFEIRHLATLQGRMNEGKPVPFYLVLACSSAGQFAQAG